MKLQRTWYMAHKDCKFRGLELVSILNDEENEALTAALSKQFQTFYFWH